MQRRIELAKGLLHHPGVLLLDEPTTGLDPGARRDLWQYLTILRDEEHVSAFSSPRTSWKKPSVATASPS